MKKIFFVFLLFFCCDVSCQNEELMNLIYFVRNPTNSCMNFEELKLSDNLMISNVGEFFGTEDSYLLIMIDNKSLHYIKGELLKFDTSHFLPRLYVRYSKCCGGDMTLYKCFFVDVQRDSLILVEQLSVADAIEISQQDHIDTVQHFFNKDRNRLLRSSPEINEEKWVDELRQQGNAFGKLYNGAEGYIISKSNFNKRKFCLAAIKKIIIVRLYGVTKMIHFF